MFALGLIYEQTDEHEQEFSLSFSVIYVYIHSYINIAHSHLDIYSLAILIQS